MKKRIAIASLAFSAAGLVGLAMNESYTSKAIQPVKNDKWTIGLGSTYRDDGTPVQKGDTITVPKALQRTLKHVQKDEGIVKQCITVELHQHEYDFIIDNAYNFGAEKFCQSTMARKFNERDYEGACKEILRWRFYQGKDCSLPQYKKLCGGLWTRRQAAYKHCMNED